MTRLKAWLEDARDRLWFLPALFTLAAIGLAFVTLALDERVLDGAPLDGPGRLVFGGGVDGARGVLEAVAGGAITVAGLVFSITIVTLHLASQQFTPRILRQFTSDRLNQATLGVFTATFVYSLLTLSAVRSPGEMGGPFVPALSVTVASGLGLLSIGLLIFFISHSAREVQAVAAIDRAARHLLRGIAHPFPESIGEGVATVGAELPEPEEPPAVVCAEEAGYLQSVDGEALLDRTESPEREVGGLLLRMEVRIGAFVLPGTPLVSVWPAEAAGIELGRRVRSTFVIGRERDPDHDLEYGFIELNDIAVKALSTGINDPTTAALCIDRLAEALVALGRRELPPSLRRSRDGRIHFIARQTDFEWIVGLAFDRIRHFADGEASVLRHVVKTFGRIAACVPEERRAPLRAQAEAALRQAERSVRDPLDLAAVRSAAGWLREEERAGGDDAGGGDVA